MKQYSRVCANVNLNAASHNMEAMHALIKSDTKIFAVIKTDGYGHGAVEIAHEIEGLDYLYGFCVATVEEGTILRRHAVKKPILILGYTFPEQYEELIMQDISLAVFSYEMAQQLSDTASKMNKNVAIHIAIDTGMSRIGYQVDEKSRDEIVRISKLPHMIMQGIFTHFAKADETDKTNTYGQMQLFYKMINMCKDKSIVFQYVHCSNSAGIVDLPEANMDIVRAGITLYGLWPSNEIQKERLKLLPLLELKSHVSHVKDLEEGREISYGGTFITDKKMRIATIPVGYGDGYPRGLSNKGYVLIKGEPARILGRVCMDQFMVDVSNIENVSAGTEVTLVGKDGNSEITIEELSDLSGRFNYEFACNLGKRIPRVYYKDNKIVSTKDYFME